MHKITKRKTRVIRRNIHPTFMEMLVYRMSLENVQKRLLQVILKNNNNKTKKSQPDIRLLCTCLLPYKVSAWSYDRVQENQFLGAVNIPLESLSLTEEHVAWYPLGHLHM
jgi:phosphatidylinositol-4-phosphate 3-kinase